MLKTLNKITRTTYISGLMVLVVGLLAIGMLRDSIFGFFKDKKTQFHTEKDSLQSDKYIIRNSSPTQAKS